MAKSAYYFTHDSNASQDPKILQMCSVYKAEGYGWYWMFIEQMRDQEDYRLQISGKYAIDAFASRFYADAKRLQEFIDDCVKEFHLFSRDKDYLWSESLIRRMKFYNDKSEKARESALKRWKPQTQNNANAMPTHNISDANASKNDALNKVNKLNILNKKEILKKKVYGEFNNVLLTDEEVTKLKDTFNGNYEAKLQYFSGEKSAKGYKYTSDYAAILTWDRNDKKKEGESHGIDQKPTSRELPFKYKTPEEVKREYLESNALPRSPNP